MLRVGLTGGAGAGKSTVAARLKQLGALVIDADALAREVLAPGTDGLREVVSAFGDGVLRPDGSLDRAALAAVVFADPQRRRLLEAITHPRIAARTAQLVAAAPDDAVVVDAPVDQRVERLVGRGLTEADARARIATQASRRERQAVADVWLDNDQSTDDLVAAVDRLWQERLVPST